MAWDPVGPCRRVAGELMGPCHRVAAARWGQGPHVAGHRRDPVAVERLDKRATWASAGRAVKESGEGRGRGRSLGEFRISTLPRPRK